MTRGFLRFILDAVRNDDDNFGGGMRAEGAYELVLAEGIGDGQINRLYDSKLTLEVPTGAGGLVLDLQALATKPDATLDAARIKALWIEPAADNTATIAIEPDTGGGNPWLGLFQTAGAPLLAIPGCLLAFADRAGWTVSAGSKDLKLSHGSGASQYVTIKILASTLV